MAVVFVQGLVSLLAGAVVSGSRRIHTSVGAFWVWILERSRQECVVGRVGLGLVGREGG